MNANNEEGRSRPPPRPAETVQQTQRYREKQQGTWKQFCVAGAQGVLGDEQTDWRSEKHLRDLAEEFGFYAECN